MKRNAMSLKAIINNIAKENKVSAQSVLQTYMLERLLERISISKYKDNFIIKGGMLISAMIEKFKFGHIISKQLLLKNLNQL